MAANMKTIEDHLGEFDATGENQIDHVDGGLDSSDVGSGDASIDSGDIGGGDIGGGDIGGGDIGGGDMDGGV